MKHNRLIMLCCTAALALLLTACGNTSSGGRATPALPTDEPAQTSTRVAASGYRVDFKKSTTAIDDYKTDCDQAGTIVTLEYDTPAYAINDLFGVDETLRKAVTIYLPYDYTASQQYNILYLLHGTRGPGDDVMEEYWLASDQWGQSTRNVLDNMIMEGLCEPVIVVTPNYYAAVEGYTITETELTALADEVGDAIAASPENVWPMYFGDELRNNIVPAVERQYSTYADGDTSNENLVATRDHRAFAGLSRGAMAVARSGLMTNADIFAYFGSFSGVWAEFGQFKYALTEGEQRHYHINYWYNGNGIGDFALENHETFKTQVLKEMRDKFVDDENYAWIVLRDGAHMYSSWVVDLYNSLLAFFPADIE